MNKTTQRTWPILVMVISALVILICAAGVIGIWVIRGAASSATVQLLQAVDHVAQLVRDGITYVDTDLATIEETVGSIEAAANQLSQNVNDQGLILTLLPPTKEEQLTAAVQSVRDDLAAVRDFANATREMVQAINKLPFVNLPGESLAALDKLQEGVNGLTSLVDELKTSIGQFRSQAATSISRLTQPVASLNNLLGEIRAELAQTDADLSSLQEAISRLQSLLTAIYLWSAILATLLALWIVYTQVVMINRALQDLRAVDSRAAASEPEQAAAESDHPEAIVPTQAVQADEETNPSDDGEQV
ncbi:MAG: hypothetical protein ACK2UW_12110 [Anaerolineales bacterium]|jgi:heme exporter protein D